MRRLTQVLLFSASLAYIRCHTAERDVRIVKQELPMRFPLIRATAVGVALAVLAARSAGAQPVETVSVQEVYSQAPDAAHFVPARLGDGVWLKNRQRAQYPVFFRSATAAGGTVAFWFRVEYVSGWPPQVKAVDLSGICSFGNGWNKKARTCYLALPGKSIVIDRAFCAGFHHCVYTWDATGERTYLDGDLVAETAGQAAGPKDTADCSLRMTAPQGITLDELIVLDQALPQDDVRKLFTASSAWTITPATVFYASFDGTLEARSSVQATGDAGFIRMAVHIGRPCATFLATDQPAFTARILNSTSADRELAVKVLVHDVSRAPVLSTAIPVAAGSGGVTDVAVDLSAVPGKGLFWASLSLVDGEAELAQVRIPYAVTCGVDPAGLSPGDMATGYYHAYPFPALPEEKWVALKTEAGWSNLEPEPEQWRFSQLDRAVDAYLGRGCVPVFPLGRGAPEWYTSQHESKGSFYGYFFPNADDAEGMALWLRFVRTVATRYRGKIRDYEFFAEYYGRTKAAYYVRVFNATAAALHGVDPDLRLASTLGGYASWRTAVIPGIARTADYWTVHPYGMAHATMKGDEHYAPYLEMLAQHGASTQLAGTETGCWQALTWAVDDDGYPLDRAAFDAKVKRVEMPAFFTKRGRGAFVDFFTGAFRIVRQQVQCQALGFQYNMWWSNAGGGAIADVSYQQHTPSPISVAYVNVAGLLAGYRHVRRLDLGAPSLRGYLFRKGDDHRLVVMTDATDETSMVFPRLGGNSLDVVDLYGNPVPFERQQGAIRLALKPLTPLYVRNIAQVLEQDRPVLKIEPAAEAYPGAEAIVTVQLHNPLREAVSGTLALSIPGLGLDDQRRTVALPGMGSGRETFTIPLPESVMSNQPLRVALETNAAFLGTVRRSAMLPVRRAVTAPRGKVTVDGVLDEWGSPAAFAIVLDSDEQIIKGIPHTKRYMMDQRVDWAGPHDLSVRAAIRHDSEFIYVAVRGTDDVLMNRWFDEPIYLYMDDSVEVFIDGRPDAAIGSAEFVGLGVYHIKMAPRIGEQASVAYVSKPRGHKIPGLRCASKQLADGYALELRIPKRAFPGFRFEPGAVMGLTVQINDQDVDMHAHGGAKSVLNWTGTRGVSHDPSKFCTLILK